MFNIDLSATFNEIVKALSTTTISADFKNSRIGIIIEKDTSRTEFNYTEKEKEKKEDNK